MGQETGSCLGSFDTGVNYLQLIAAHLIDGHRINADSPYGFPIHHLTLEE